jgi:alanine racemase
MNWITVDVGPDGSAHAGDEAVLIGRQGGAEIWADELAKLAKTIPYEILTSINPLAPRDYRETPRARNRTPAV